MIAAADKPAYRSIRNGWGLVLAAGWVVYRYRDLDAHRRIALLALKGCDGIMGSAKCWLQQGGITTEFNGSVMVAVLLSPLAFVVTHYFAKWRVTQRNATEERLRQQTIRVQSAAADQARIERLTAMEAENASSRGALDRGEFIQKIGAVSDFLDLLPHERDPARIANIRVGAAQALRDLTAKYPLDQLRTMVETDPALHLCIAALVPKLRQLDFDQSGDAQVLLAAYQPALAFSPTSD